MYFPNPVSESPEDLRRYIFDELEKIRNEFNLIQNIEDWHEVGATGEPAFNTNWSNWTPLGSYNTAAFYKHLDRVYLKGLVKHTTGGSATYIYTLPEGYRSVERELIATIGDNALARLDIYDTGEIYLNNGSALSYLSLDGISFRV